MVPHPEEPYVHEWVHCLESFYRSIGYKIPGADDATKYGCESQSSSGFNGFYDYYKDIFNANVWDANTRTFIGITNDMWRISPLQLSTKERTGMP